MSDASQAPTEQSDLLTPPNRKYPHFLVASKLYVATSKAGFQPVKYSPRNDSTIIVIDPFTHQPAKIVRHETKSSHYRLDPLDSLGRPVPGRSISLVTETLSSMPPLIGPVSLPYDFVYETDEGDLFFIASPSEPDLTSIDRFSGMTYLTAGNPKIDYSLATHPSEEPVFVWFGKKGGIAKPERVINRSARVVKGSGVAHELETKRGTLTFALPFVNKFGFVNFNDPPPTQPSSVRLEQGGIGSELDSPPHFSIEVEPIGDLLKVTDPTMGVTKGPEIGG